MSQFNDHDVLDIAGKWKLTFDYSYGVGRPFGQAARSFDMQYEITGPGDHGGVKFKGHYVDSERLPALHVGETFYDDRGVQIVQILEFLHNPNQYLALLCGRHLKDAANPAKISIHGAWVDVGGVLSGFELVKLP